MLYHDSSRRFHQTIRGIVWYSYKYFWSHFPHTFYVFTGANMYHFPISSTFHSDTLSFKVCVNSRLDKLLPKRTTHFKQINIKSLVRLGCQKLAFTALPKLHIFHNFAREETELRANFCLQFGNEFQPSRNTLVLRVDKKLSCSTDRL